MATFEQRVAEAWARRAPLREGSTTTAYRVLNARGDGVPDVTLDWFDQVAVLSHYRTFSPDEEMAQAEVLTRVLGARAVYLKRRPREARHVANTAKAQVAPEHPLSGEVVDSVVVRENGARFLIRPGQGLSVGLYLDMRDTRAWVSRHIQGRTVLNCFSYTCAFGVLAHQGGARRAVNLDLSRRVLDWGEENLSLNGGVPDRKDHIAGDTFDWLGRFARKSETFDCVILDPPSFSTSPKGRFSAARDYPALVAAAAQVVSRGGLLVACCNLESLEGVRFEQWIQQGVERAGRQGRVIEALGPSTIDFPEGPEEPPALKVRILSLHG